MKGLKRVLIGGLSTATLAAAMFAVSVPANAGGGRAPYGDGVAYGDQYDGGRGGANHYSRQHPDSLAFDGVPDAYGPGAGPSAGYDPGYAAGGVVGGALAGTGAVVDGTLGAAGAVVGAPYQRNAAGYYGDGNGYYNGGQQYVRRGAYLYPVGPGAGGPGYNNPGAF